MGKNTIKAKYDDNKGLYQKKDSTPGFLIASSSNGGKFICHMDWGIGLDNFLAKMKIRNNDADMACVIIDQNMAGNALKIDAANSGIGANDAFWMNCSGTTEHGMKIISSQDGDASKPLVSLETTDSAFDQTVLEVIQDGSGNIVDFKDASTSILSITGAGLTTINCAGTLSLTNLGSAAGTDLVLDGGNLLKTKSSDARLKENISSIDSALNKTLALDGRYFNFIIDQSKTQQVGFIAQEVEKVIPQLTAINPDGYMTVKYGEVTALLVEAIKELNEKVEKLTERIDILEYAKE